MRQADCVTILTDHVEFDADEIVAHANLVVDTRNATGGRTPEVFRLGAPQPREMAAPSAPVSARQVGASPDTARPARASVTGSLGDSFALGSSRLDW
mgnify:CR=1 FL=1